MGRSYDVSRIRAFRTIITDSSLLDVHHRFVAQICGHPPPAVTDAAILLQQGHFASLNVEDLLAITPWMTEKWERITRVNGADIT